jgi:hypothetical protein
VARSALVTFVRHRGGSDRPKPNELRSTNVLRHVTRLPCRRSCRPAPISRRSPSPAAIFRLLSCARTLRRSHGYKRNEALRSGLDRKADHDPCTLDYPSGCLSADRRLNCADMIIDPSRPILFPFICRDETLSKCCFAQCASVHSHVLVASKLLA